MNSSKNSWDPYLGKLMKEAQRSTAAEPEVRIAPIQEYDLRVMLEHRGMISTLPVLFEILENANVQPHMYKHGIFKFFLNPVYIRQLIASQRKPSDLASFTKDNLLCELISHTERLVSKYVLNAQYFSKTTLSTDQAEELEGFLLSKLARVPKRASMHLCLLEYFFALDEYLGEVQAAQKEAANKLFSLTKISRT